jgi:hypothetical protein
MTHIILEQSIATPSITYEIISSQYYVLCLAPELTHYALLLVRSGLCSEEIVVVMPRYWPIDGLYAVPGRTRFLNTQQPLSEFTHEYIYSCCSSGQVRLTQFSLNYQDIHSVQTNRTPNVDGAFQRTAEKCGRLILDKSKARRLFFKNGAVCGHIMIFYKVAYICLLTRPLICVSR